MCYDTTGLLPQQDEVIEDITCGYHIMVYSRAGCPQQVRTEALASGRGGADDCIGVTALSLLHEHHHPPPSPLASPWSPTPRAVAAAAAASCLQCPFTGIPNKLCGGHGLCDWDTSQNAARCFCNQGWSGADCMTQGDKGLPPPISYAGNVAGAFFGGLFAGLVLVLGFVAFKSFVSSSTAVANAR